MNTQQMVLTAIGPDRPGLVKEISSVIHDCGANLEDSRMAVLAGDFALLILFSGTTECLENIKSKCKLIEEKLSFNISFKQATQRPEDREYTLYQLQGTGVDQPGIIHRVSEILADFEINVLSLESKLTRAAFHGTSMFSFNATIQIYRKNVVESLIERLEQACEKLDLTYDLEVL